MVCVGGHTDSTGVFGDLFVVISSFVTISVSIGQDLYQTHYERK